MKVTKILTLAFVLASMLFQLEALAQASANKVDWSSFNMGFASPASASTVAKSAAGQTFIGAMQQGNTRIESGFLENFLFRDPIVGVSERRDDQGIPATYELRQNYPNPFNPSTTIAFALPKPSQVTLKMFDVFGREVTTLAEGGFPAGWHQVIVEAGKFSSGVFLSFARR
ncbi:hypothetical protein EDS67_27930 [candidate division KSB1 bacterium]|nr:MAG: hypothetical protein EDS67_27930 [candidate division KSB1 bacterium]MBC6951629.1 hypothetical protein [candidate division KSB1 bacterium]MCE7941098.1 hypothetical protein [Chlorobi bacterium CHB1]